MFLSFFFLNFFEFHRSFPSLLFCSFIYLIFTFISSFVYFNFHSNKYIIYRTAEGEINEIEIQLKKDVENKENVQGNVLDNVLKNVEKNEEGREQQQEGAEIERKTESEIGRETKIETERETEREMENEVEDWDEDKGSVTEMEYKKYVKDADVEDYLRGTYCTYIISDLHSVFIFFVFLFLFSISYIS